MLKYLLSKAFIRPFSEISVAEINVFVLLQVCVCFVYMFEFNSPVFVTLFISLISLYSPFMATQP